MIKLIAVDLDGTLLDSQSRVSENNKKSIKKCLEKGLKVAMITGQNLHYAKEIIKSLGLVSPHALANGALVVDHRFENISYRLIDPKSYRAIVDFCRQKKLQLRVCTLDGHLVFDKDYIGLGSKKKIVKTDDLLAKHIVDNVLLCTIKTMDNTSKIKSEDISRDVKVRHAGLNYINIFNCKAGKTYGLKKILEYLGISAHQVMAIGDGENDLGMIKMAKIGVAMGNASRKVKDCADFVTLDNDQDGLSIALERFF